MMDIKIHYTRHDSGKIEFCLIPTDASMSHSPTDLGALSTQLNAAIDARDLDNAKALMQAGADPCFSGFVASPSSAQDQASPIWHALELARLSFFPVLLGKDPLSLPAFSRQRGEPVFLMDVAMRSTDKVFDAVLKTCWHATVSFPVEFRERLWEIALWQAKQALATTGGWPAVNYEEKFFACLEHGASPPGENKGLAWKMVLSGKKKNSDRPFLCWAMQRDDTFSAVLKRAFADGMSPDTSFQGLPLLHVACQENAILSAEAVIEAGADLHRRCETSRKETSLFYAKLADSQPIVRMILATIAKRNIGDVIDRHRNQASATILLDTDTDHANKSKSPSLPNPNPPAKTDEAVQLRLRKSARSP
jgi:hypothetical protein